MTNPAMHTEGIDDGKVDDQFVATDYNPCLDVILADGYIRITKTN